MVGVSKPPTGTEFVSLVSGSEWQPPELSAQVIGTKPTAWPTPRASLPTPSWSSSVKKSATPWSAIVDSPSSGRRVGEGG